MKILITGAAGFIGFHLVLKLLNRNDEIIGLDNINDYYDVNIKFGRLEQSGIDWKIIQYNLLSQSSKFNNYKFIKLNLEDKVNIHKLLEQEKFDVVVNLAAQAGVRYSITNPEAYLNSNLIGFFNIIEASKLFSVQNFVYASSSSVYGLNKQIPFSTHNNVDHPISLYAASKKCNELIAHSYSYIYNIPTTGLRFFTVYGPWGRPDMALFKFTKAILENEPIDVYNHGNMIRDFTYIDDIIVGIIKVVDNPASSNNSWNGEKPDPSSSLAPFKVYNIGRSEPVQLISFIETIEKELDKKATKNLLPMQTGDVPATWADSSDLEKDLNYKPLVSINEGVKRFIKWYKDFYKI